MQKQKHYFPMEVNILAKLQFAACLPEDQLTLGKGEIREKMLYDIFFYKMDEDGSYLFTR